MQNFGNFSNNRTSILSELANGNAELGQAFAMIINDMVVQNGITNPKAENFDIVPKSWRDLANKPDKTEEDYKKLENNFNTAVREFAESYLLFIAKEVKNLTGKLEYPQYEAYMLKYRFGHYNVMNKPEYLNKVKVQIKNAFNKISAHGEATGDNLIDKKDMAAFIYAIATKSKRDNNNKFSGFQINGIITPEEYAVNESNLFEPEDNLLSLKLRMAYKILNES